MFLLFLEKIKFLEGYSLNMKKEIFILLKKRYKQLIRTMEQLKQKNGEIPFGREFVGSIRDFGILNYLKKGEDIPNKFTVEQIEHLISSLEECIYGYEKQEKLDFSLKNIMQIDDVLNGRNNNNKELLQSLYMTIFSKYNDDIKVDENYSVTEEFARTVYRFKGEELPSKLMNRRTSEQDIGTVFMTTDEYNKLYKIWKNRNIEEFRMEIVQYTLENIRNRMMHGDFENIVDKEGNDIVKISPYGFKAKFYFDCITEFYEAISEEIQRRVRKEDSLFDFEEMLLGKNNDIANDKDKLMSVLLPLYINSFITYNSKNKGEINKIRKRIGKNEEDFMYKCRFIDTYYKDKNEDSFIYKVANYNRQNCEKTYNAHQIFEHLRNSAVHNYFKCKDGMFYIYDYEKIEKENGVNEMIKTAEFVIPYDMFTELVNSQANIARKHFRISETTDSGPNGVPGDER